MRSCLMLMAMVLTAQECLAWSESGHHLITVMAFERLAPEIQREVLEILRAHPRFADDFKPLAKLDGTDEIERWTIGRAGYWPDVARRTAEFNRSNWHYQLGASLIVGRPLNVPEAPPTSHATATLETRDLHILQAIDLCRSVFRDKTKPDADRAIAFCWIAHLVGDAHQPCHSGSLYHEDAFPKGDRGANSIPTVQSKNLHAVWDGLLGPRFNAGDITRRQREILSDKEFVVEIENALATESGRPSEWLEESKNFARSHVYSEEVLKAVNSIPLGREMAPLQLSETYLKAAGKLARRRAAFASFRLAAIIKSDLN